MRDRVSGIISSALGLPNNLWSSDCKHSLYCSAVGPRQIFDVKGEPWLYVGSEGRAEQRVCHFVGTKQGTVFHHYAKKMPPEAKLVNDDAGRKEAEVAWRINRSLEQERDILNEVMREAVKLTSDKEAERLRSLFLKKMEAVELRQR